MKIALIDSLVWGSLRLTPIICNFWPRVQHPHSYCTTILPVPFRPCFYTFPLKAGFFTSKTPATSKPEIFSNNNSSSLTYFEWACHKIFIAIGYTVIKVPTSPRNLKWLTGLYFLMTGRGLNFYYIGTYLTASTQVS